MLATGSVTEGDSIAVRSALYLAESVRNSAQECGDIPESRTAGQIASFRQQIKPFVFMRLPNSVDPVRTVRLLQRLFPTSRETPRADQIHNRQEENE
jgi:hypothetical protein